jgi:hypothetical protein
MSLSDEFLRQVGHNPLRAAIEFGRDALIKGSNLSNLHRDTVTIGASTCKITLRDGSGSEVGS